MSEHAGPCRLYPRPGDFPKRQDRSLAWRLDTVLMDENYSHLEKADRRHLVVDTGAFGAAPCGDSIRWLRRLFDHCDVGTAPTLPRLGKLLMSTQWPMNQDGSPRQHSLPGRDCRLTLKSWSHGQRKQIIRTGTREEVDRLKDPDLRSAYPNHARWLPTGTACGCRSEPVGASTWFCLCDVEVLRTLPLGPFPVPPMPLRWPTEPGSYRTWLWAEQAFDAREAGCVVTVRYGWFWDAMTACATSFVDHALMLRETAPGGRDGQIGTWVKRATNAAIGYWGIGDYYETERDCKEGEEEILEGNRLTGKTKVLVPGRPTPIHWHQYIVMQCGRTAYRLALPHAKKGTLYGIETDRIYYAA